MCSAQKGILMNIYDFKVSGRNGETVDLSQYRGQVLLVMNSATACGFTPQYDEIRDIFEKFQDKGFLVLDFPSNQFGNQAPGTNEEIAEFCSVKYGIQFPIMGKIDVNGEHADPLFTYLKKSKGFAGFDLEHPKYDKMNSMLAGIDPDYMNNSDIKWNFTKFLIDKNGEVVERFEPTADLKKIEQRIVELL